ncbi:somatostatin-1A [Chanos chanos]|uniref:Somatostatin-1A n=1 Tax=Chanos chanos TaxID=29144 RepID=A0A6J2VSS9_CHACN|nr:somatostatin-1A-like [Chanos chanos]
MSCSQLQVFTVVVSISVLACTVNAAPQRDVLTQILNSDMDPKSSEELSRVLLVKLLSDLVSPRDNDILSEVEALGGRDMMVRQLPLSHRERKAGCRNFFWKTFTSC